VSLSLGTSLQRHADLDDVHIMTKRIGRTRG
jgi:hypothetical protein